MKSILNQIRIVFLFITILIMSSAVYAQNEEEENADAPKEQSSSDKAQEAANNLANPNATIGFLTFPIDLTWYKGDLPGANDQTAFRFNFQPSLPYKLGEGRNLFVRPLIPVIIKQPVYGENGFEDKGVALGDISIDVAYGKSWKGGFVTMFGGFVSMPTATDDNLGSNRWLMGPELVFGKVGKWGSFYTLFFHSWSVSGNEEGNMSALGGQYFYTINLKNARAVALTGVDFISAGALTHSVRAVDISLKMEL